MVLSGFESGTQNQRGWREIVTNRCAQNLSTKLKGKKMPPLLPLLVVISLTVASAPRTVVSEETLAKRAALCLHGEPRTPHATRVPVAVKVELALGLLRNHDTPGPLSVVRHFAERPGVTITNYREGYPGKPGALLYCEMCGWWSGAQCPEGALAQRRQVLDRWKAKELRASIASMNNGSVCGTAGHLLLQVGGTPRTISQGGRWASDPPLTTSFASAPGGGGGSSAAERCGAGHSWGIGYEDPRLFMWGGAPYVIMNGCAGANRRLFLYDVERDHIAQLWVSDNDNARATANRNTSERRLDLGAVQKNWTPYVHNGKLMLVYSFGTESILGLLEVVNPAVGECALVYGSLAYRDDAPYIGSTPLQLWSYPFYVGFVHTRQVIDRSAMKTSVVSPFCGGGESTKRCTVYRSVPVVLNAATYKTWYGEELHLTPPDHPNASPKAGDTKDVQYPYDFTFDSNGDVKLCLEFQDSCPGWAHINFQDFCRSLPDVMHFRQHNGTAAGVGT